jgi:hypothetical protein
MMEGLLVLLAMVVLFIGWAIYDYRRIVAQRAREREAQRHRTEEDDLP